jgi:hypothetical protein
MQTAPVFSHPTRRTYAPRVLARLVAHPLAQAAMLFAACAAVFSFVQFGTGALADNDGYYHMKMGLLIREQGLKPAFPWLPMSILNAGAFYDHHLLYHVYLALFAGDGRPETMILGAKLASIVLPALACVAIWWLLRGMGVRWPAIWAIGLFGLSEAFLYRMSMPRAQAASLLVLALALHWLLAGRFRRLIPLGFAYVWLYNAFPLLLLVAGVYAVAVLLVDRRLEWRAVAYPALGIALGLIVNPYVPANIAFIIDHLVPKIGSPTIPVGNEWYPYETWTLVGNSGVALAAWVLGALALGWREVRMDRATLATFLLSVAFGFLLFKSRRFVEYFPPFALIFAAASSAPIVDRWARNPRRWAGRLAALLLAAALVAPLGLTVPRARATMSRSAPAATYAEAASWLGRNSPAGSMVFQTDWDDFPRLFFYNSANIYTIGLDPTYMERFAPDLYADWVKLTRGEVRQPGATIRSRFGAAYVLTDLRHTAFLEQAAADPHMREMYRDEFAAVFVVE